MSEYEITADRAVLPDCIATGVRVVVRDGRIAAVDQSKPGPGARHVAGTLLPGLVDLQVNGGGGASVDEATPRALDTVARAVLAGGASAFLPTLITAPWERLLDQVAKVAAWIDRAPADGAVPIGLHVEGPCLEVAGAHDASCFVDPTKERIAALLAAARGKLRLVTLASSRNGAAAAVAQLRAAGVAVAIGHVADPRGFPDCVDAGAGLATHLFNAMGPLHHREPGIAGRVLDEPRLAAALIVDGAHVHPAMLRLAYAALGPDRTLLVTDAVAAMGMPDGDYTLAGAPVRSQSGVVRDGKGSLAGSALTMARAAANWLQFVPATGPWTLARIAAANPANLVGSSDFGAIAPGRRAAFATLRENCELAVVRAADSGS